jgi:hypothetical protein
MTVVLVPIAAYFKHGTGVTWVDLLVATKPQFLSGLLAGAVGLLVKLMLGGKLPPIPYLFVGVGAVLGIYAWTLLIAMNQKHVYLDLLSRLLPPKYQEILWGRRKWA